MLKSSGRRIDLSQPFVDAMLPEGHRLHVVLEGISRGFSAVNIRKFVLTRGPARTTWSSSGSLTPQRGGVPRGVGARRPQHPRRRRHAGRQDHDAELPGRGDPRRRPGGLAPRRSSSSASPTPTGCAMQTRQCGLEGTGEIAAARPGQGEPADAADPDHRRRGARRGVPRPAARPQRRAARACAPCTPTARARRWSRCARCRCSPARTSRPGSWCPTVAASRSTWSSTSASTTHGVRRVNEIVGVPGRVENDVIETEPIFVRRGGELRRTGGMPPRPERYERVGIDVHARPATGRG